MMAPRTEKVAKSEALGAAFRGVRVRVGYTPDLLFEALKDSLLKFDPRVQIRNPVMFVVWLGMLVTLSLAIHPDLFGSSSASHLYNGIVTAVLALTVWFANYAEALAEGRGKAKATALRQTRSDLIGRRVRDDGSTERVPAADLRRGDLIRIRERRRRAGGRRCRRRRGLRQRSRHHRGVGTRLERTRNRHVLVGHRRDDRHFRLAEDSRFDRSRRLFP
jgi:hypothetical protein